MSEELRDEVHELTGKVHDIGIKVAGLDPMVRDVHAVMPRLVMALERLAAFEIKFENNDQEHTRLHYRIRDNEEKISGLAVRQERYEELFRGLHEEHVVRTAVVATEKHFAGEAAGKAKESIWDRLKIKAAEQAVGILSGVVVAFVLWGFGMALVRYPPFVKLFLVGGGQ